jgi:hypothetical protein
MSRQISTNNLAAAKAGHCHPITFVYLGLDAGDIRVHNSIGDYTWGSETWLGMGDFGKIGEVKETEKVAPYSIEVSLSGIDSTLINEALNNDFFNRPMSIYLGWLDESHELVDTPDEMWSGKIQKMDIRTGLENRITVTGLSELAIFRKQNGKLFNDQAQQKLFAGDLFFQYQPQMEDAQPEWLGPVRTGQAYNAAGLVLSPGTISSLQ